MKLMTWNLHGLTYNNGAASSYNKAKEIMSIKEIDVVCLQETGNLFKAALGCEWSDCGNGLYRTEEQLVTRSRGKKIHTYHVQWGNNNFRCDLAILVNSDLDLCQPIIFTPFGCRPIIGITIKDNIAIYDIHAPTNSCNLGYICSAITGIVNLANNKQFILAGDFNNNPYVVQKNIDIHLVYFPNQATHRDGHCLDYCITSVLPNACKPIIVQNEQSTYSDHYPVIFEF